MHNSTTRFSNRVEQYVKYRPGYPKEITFFLQQYIRLQPSFVLADIGSGTGISSQLFLDNGNAVYAVEPNNEMRSKAEELLGGYHSFISINGTAENTTLTDSSINMIVSGQAFHWFDAIKTKMEFRRIAKPHSFCVLMWNERLVETPFEIAYEQLLHNYAIDYLQVDHRNVNEEKLKDFFSPNDFIAKSFANKQLFDFEGLKGRLLSSSYVPEEMHPRYTLMMDELKNIFSKHAINNAVQFNYTTKLYIGKVHG